MQFNMKLTKQQAEVYEILATLLRQRGRQWLLGYLMGLIIRLGDDDYQLRRLLRDRAKDN